MKSLAPDHIPTADRFATMWSSRVADSKFGHRCPVTVQLFIYSGHYAAPFTISQPPPHFDHDPAAILTKRLKL
jgi:hypothetical protein